MRSVLTCLFVIVISLPVVALTNYVSPAGSHTPPYTNWATAANDIQAAVDATSNGNVVLIGPAIYALTSQVVVSKDIALVGDSGAAATVLDGGFPARTNRCVFVGSPNVSLSGLTLANGFADNNRGGGVRLNVAGGALINCMFTSNRAALGGGAFIRTNAQVETCVFTGNSARDGGGIYAEGEGVVNACTFCGNVGSSGGGINMRYGGQIIKSLFVTNRASSGGGAYIAAHTLLISNTFVENALSGHGGGAGILLDRGGTAIWCTVASSKGSGLKFNGMGGVAIACVITNNAASWGAGAYMYKGGRMHDCLVVSNTAAQGGGGVYLNTSAFMSNCVIRDNVAVAARGGGLHTEAGSEVYDTLIARNHSGADSGAIHCHANGLFVRCTIISNHAGSVCGGVYFYLNGTAIHSTIAHNTSDHTAGGIYARRGGAVINCHVVSNSAGASVGGAYLEGRAIMRSSLVAGNRANNLGGGAYITRGGTIQNCTIAANSATNGGVFCRTNGVILNTIVYYNPSFKGEEFKFEGLPAGLTADCVSCSVEVPGHHNDTNTPRFVKPCHGDYHLACGSPCIDSAETLPWMASETDLDGRAWSHGGSPDRGAYEYYQSTAALMRVTMAALDLGIAEFGVTNTAPVPIENVGMLPLTGNIDGVATPFGIAAGAPYALTECTGTSVVFRFVPTSEGVFSNIVILTGGGDAPLLLTGVGIPEPCAALAGLFLLTLAARTSLQSKIEN